LRFLGTPSRYGNTKRRKAVLGAMVRLKTLKKGGWIRKRADEILQNEETGGSGGFGPTNCRRLRT